MSSQINLKRAWFAVVCAGVMAGILSTLAQIFLWLIFTDNFPNILYRDARLTSAIVLGNSVLPPPATFDLVVMLVATLLHFSLSIIYSAFLAGIATLLKSVPIILVGVGFGFALYMVNLYGFTELFPWFEQTRGWITLITHGFFGIVAISVYRWIYINSELSELDEH